ncbi:hypothetical protein A9W99_20475 [Mycobacterium sp. 1164966.3]|uniref:DUF7373 family lipoprotein n=1 Tax=Mycobacterium sp. 1164966.3 TaxID=1856861 RepID=UPI0007FBAE4A|nr:hypothetical protein [Mycobacterium sp. 1164966.3]OBA79451.1 hypothetical protein A9W99_20475 [Mycobacterium sp. 1164966.3]
MVRRFSGVARRLAVAVTAVLLPVSGCTTTVDGAAVKAKEADTANVALMDTGTYPTTLGHIFGTAGTDTYGQHLLEAHRLAEFVTGPWQVDETLTQHPFLELLIQIQPIADANNLGIIFSPAFSSVAAKHGYITGFSTRRQSPGTSPLRELTNAVLMFPDPAAPTAAAGPQGPPPPPRAGPPPPSPPRNTNPPTPTTAKN